MEILIFLAIVTLMAVMLSTISGLGKKILYLGDKIDALKEEIKSLKNEGVNEEIKKKPSVTLNQGITPPVIVTPPVVKKEEPPVIVPKKYPVKDPVNEFVPTSEPVNIPPAIKEAPKKYAPSFFEKNPDLEKFIGENLINKIGIAILVLGIGFFVKYAIDQNWINEIGRVFIGILCGGILLGFAHKLRKSFKAFSSVLVGGGMAIFYFTIAIAFHEYHLLSQTAAFIVMVIITAFSVLLSIAYDRKELAILAIIGGFASPVMVSTGSGNYIVLFTYILILNCGMLTLAYYRRWHVINIICYVFTIILYGGWLIKQKVDEENIPYIGGLIFATLFYLIFFLMNIINNIKENRKFLVFEISILLSNTFLYYSAGMILLDDVNEGIYKGLFTALIAVFNFIFAFQLFRNKKVDINLVYLLIGLVLTFLSLAAPVQLEGNYITLFWSIEAVLLLWLSQKSGIQLIKISSIIVMMLMFISLVMDWFNIYAYRTEELNIIFNKGFITGIVSLASIFATILLLKKETLEIFPGLPRDIYKYLLSIIFTIFLYITFLLELSYQLPYYIEWSETKSMIIGSYNLAFVFGFIIYSILMNTHRLKTISIIMGIIGTLAYTLYYHQQIIDIRNYYLEPIEVAYNNTKAGTDLWHFLYHYFLIILCVLILIYTLKNIQSVFKLKSDGGKVYLWFFVAALLFIASSELDHIVLLANYQAGSSIYHIINQNHKIGFPILWGLCSFILMIVGMNKKMKILRIISLSIFFITLLKLFILDIRGISEGGKIAAFICLGILLLVVSFMYQKLKKLVMEDEVKPTES
ncbi:MAG: DUF2339 domain-containing protein [Cytophagaceae bacterium]|nr:DUF2339 domain-containing protein [Cytophagaceae bacterium]